MLCGGKKKLAKLSPNNIQKAKNLPNELVKKGKEVLRQNAESVRWLLQVVCDKILKRRDEIRKELVDVKAEQRGNIECPKFWNV